MRRLTIFISLFTLITITYSQSTWEPVPGLTGSNIYRTIFNSDGVIFTSVLNGGMWTSSDMGNNWTQINYGLGETNILSFAIGSSDVLFAGTDNDGVYSYDNNTKTWNKVLTLSVKFNALGGNASGLVAAGANFGHIFKSIDNGVTWDTALVEDDISTINDILVTDGGSIFVGCDKRELYISYDSGNSWEKNTVGIAPATRINSIIMNLTGALFVGIDYGGVLKSDDGGKSWQYSSEGLPTNAAVSLLNVDSEGNLFAVLDNNSVYQSNDQGNSWTIFEEGLNGATINTIASSKNGYTLLGTNSGLYKTFTPTTNVEAIDTEVAKNFQLSQNYPNPFNPSTTIKFNIPKNEFVTISVFDATGKEVSRLLNQEMTAGSYSVSFDGSGLATGVYFYKLRTSDFVQIKKMLLLK